MPAPSVVRRVVWGVVLLGAAYFTLQAGEFSTLDIVHKRRLRREMQAQVDSLQQQVDSLTRVERLIRTDPATQERIAREDFGMVRSADEIIYKFVTPADTGADPKTVSR